MQGLPVWFSLLLLFYGTASAGNQTAYDQLILNAREGKFTPTIERLYELRKNYPASNRITNDLLEILHWAGRDKEAILLENRIDPKKAPYQTLMALAKALRNRQQYDSAILWYRAASRRRPASIDPWLGVALSLADSGRFDESKKILASVRNKGHGKPDYHLALGYLKERQGDSLSAFWEYNRGLHYAPNQGDLQRRQLLLLSRLGAPAVAREREQKEPGFFTTEELALINGDRAAAWIRYGETVPPSLSKRFQETDVAIELIRENFNRAATKKGTEWANQRLRSRYDQIVALRDRVRMDDVISEYESLLKHGFSPPYYVLQAAGDAYLYWEEPEKSRVLYQQVQKKAPNLFNAQMSYFYALIEEGYFAEARQLIDAIAASEKPWRTFKTKSGRIIWGENDRKKAATHAAALVRGFADRLDEAQNRYAIMRAEAPFSPDLRQGEGYISLWRGYPRKARRLFERQLSLWPDFMEAKLGRAFALLDLREYQKAEEWINHLSKSYPEHKRVHKAARLLTLYNKASMSLTADTSGATPTEPETTSHRYDLRFYTPPLNYQWRFFAHQFREDATIRGESASRTRTGAGIEWRRPSFIGLAELYRENFSKNAENILLSASFEYDDYWSGNLSYESFAKDIPFRGLMADVQGPVYSATATYQPDESSFAKVSGSRIAMTDGNIRDTVTAVAQWRVVNGPYIKIPVSIDLYQSVNSREKRPYFNPNHDFAATVTVDFRWLMKRRYAFHFAHNLAVNVGQYWQDGYAPGVIGFVRYEHDWALSDRLTISYRATHYRRYFDGAPASWTDIGGGINWLF